jgi:uncharacterized protein
MLGRSFAALAVLCAVVIGMTAVAMPPPDGSALAAPGRPTPTPAASPTPNPYADLTVDALSARTYGGGAITIHQTLGTFPEFTRYTISYPSDGLTIYGFMNVPVGEGPFPVIVAVHGYVDPVLYGTLDYTTSYADDLARAGFLVLHPNLRGYWPSSSGDNLFRVGMAIDVLNLIALTRQLGGFPGPLEQADRTRIGLWGHSMGGGIALRVLTISRDVRAAVLYGAMSGDERQNYEAIYDWSGHTRGLAELAVPEDALPAISPINTLDRIQAQISIHHGAIDEQVPLDWSVDLCARLMALGKAVDCFTYAGQYHVFTGEGRALFMQRVIGFYNAALR